MDKTSAGTVFKDFQYKPISPAPADVYVMLLYVLDKLIPDGRVLILAEELDKFVKDANENNRGVRVLLPIKKNISTGDVEFDASGEVIPVKTEKLVIYSTTVPKPKAESSEAPPAEQSGPQLVM